MRQGSAGTVELNARPGIGRLPKEGSVLRKYYDEFVANPGKVIRFNTAESTKNNVLRQLTDFYGLVIRKTANREERVLVGRWFGSRYEEYVSVEEKATYQR